MLKGVVNASSAELLRFLLIFNGASTVASTAITELYQSLQFFLISRKTFGKEFKLGPVTPFELYNHVMLDKFAVNMISLPIRNVIHNANTIRWIRDYVGDSLLSHSEIGLPLVVISWGAMYQVYRRITYNHKLNLSQRLASTAAVFALVYILVDGHRREESTQYRETVDMYNSVGELFCKL